MKKHKISTLAIIVASLIILSACGATIGVSKNYPTAKGGKTFGNDVGNRVY